MVENLHKVPRCAGSALDVANAGFAWMVLWREDLWERSKQQGHRTQSTSGQVGSSWIKLGKRIFNRKKSKEARGIQSQRICNIFGQVGSTYLLSMRPVTPSSIAREALQCPSAKTLRTCWIGSQAHGDAAMLQPVDVYILINSEFIYTYITQYHTYQQFIYIYIIYYIILYIYRVWLLFLCSFHSIHSMSILFDTHSANHELWPFRFTAWEMARVRSLSRAEVWHPWYFVIPSSNWT